MLRIPKQSWLQRQAGNFQRNLNVLMAAALLLGSTFGLLPPTALASEQNIFGPESATVDGDTPYSSGSINTDDYDDLSFSFDYNHESLDNGDSFTYEVFVHGVSVKSETIDGVNSDSPGFQNVIAYQTSSEVQNVELEITATTNTGSDEVALQNIVLKGDFVESEPTGPVYRTDGSGNPEEHFQTIQAAIDDNDSAGGGDGSTDNGDTVVVTDGSYDENIAIDKNITLKSENGPGSTTIAPSSGAFAVTLLGNTNDLANVTVEGFTISGGSAITLQSHSQANDGYDVTNLTYRNLVVNAGGAFGIGLFDVNGATLDNVTVNNASTAMEMIGVKDFTLQNSEIADSTRGLNVKTHPGYEANQNLDINTTAFSGGYLPITINGVSGVNITGNQITGLSATGNNATGVWVASGTDVTLEGNVIDGVTATGKTAQGVLIGGTAQTGPLDTIKLLGNEVKNVSGNPGGYGFMVNRPTTGLVVQGNHVQNVFGERWGSGLGLDADTPGAQVTNNTFAQLDTNAFPGASIGVIEQTADVVPTITIKHNNLTSDIGVENRTDGDLTIEENWWGDQSGPIVVDDSGASGGSGTAAIQSRAGQIDATPWLCQPFEDGLQTLVNGSCDTAAPATPTELKIYKGHDKTGTPLQCSESDGTIYVNTTDILIDWEPSTSGDVEYYWFGTKNNTHHNNSRDNQNEFTDGSTAYIGDMTPGHNPYHYFVSAVDANGNESAATRTCNIVLDQTAPDAPTIQKPSPRQWFKSTPIETTWTSVSDGSNIDYYQVAYSYDDEHTFGGSDCPDVDTIEGKLVSGCRNEESTSRNHAPAANEQGGVTVWVRAVDNAGNASPWSDSVHYYYDHEAPTTSIDVPSGVVGNSFTVSGDAHDNLALNRVYVQLNLQNGGRYGGTTIHLIGKGKNASWSKTFDADALNLPDGKYRAHVSVVDRAGNSGAAGWTEYFTVDSQGPDVTIATPEDDTIRSNQNAINVSGTAEDEAGINFVRVRVKDMTANERVFQKKMSNLDSDNWSADIPAGTLVDGHRYKVKAISKDSLGNTTVESVEITADNEGPVITVNNPSASDTVSNTEALTVDGTVEDELSNVNFLRVRLHDETTGEKRAFQKKLTNVGEGDWAVTIPAGTLQDGHRYDLNVISVDTVGNKTVESFSITVDNSAAEELKIPGDVIFKKDFNFEKRNQNNVNIDNSNEQIARSGNARVRGNLATGFAFSGDAFNSNATSTGIAVANGNGQNDNDENEVAGLSTSDSGGASNGDPEVAGATTSNSSNWLWLLLLVPAAAIYGVYRRISGKQQVQS